MDNKILGVGSRIKHPEYGAGVIIQTKFDFYLITFMEIGTRKIPTNYENLEIIEDLEAPDDLVSMEKIEQTLKNILKNYSDIQETVHIAEKWKNGKIILKPGDENLKPYELPIETFFHKIVMVRDRLRVIEQRINSHQNLDEDDKINLQQYITRIYGSLTSFNILFKNKTDNFVGEKSK